MTEDEEDFAISTGRILVYVVAALIALFSVGVVALLTA